MNTVKQRLRVRLKKKRDRLSKVNINKWSIAIFNHFKSEFAPLLKKKDPVMVYLSIQSEVKTTGFITYLLRKNFKVYVPSIKNGIIIPLLLKKKAKMKKGAFRIFEPAKKIPLKSIKSLGLVIVPGIAFDRRGNRLGFGKGFFDRFMKKLPKKTKKIALAFSRQIIPRVPSTKQDIKVDYIITEKNILKIKK